MLPQSSQNFQQEQDLVVDSDPVELLQLLFGKAQSFELQHEPLVALPAYFDRQIVELYQDVEEIQFLPQGLELAVRDPVAILLVRLLQWLC